MTSFATNITRVLRGTVAAQLLLLVAMPVITRLFSPANFGAVQALQSVLTFLLVCSALRLEVAILSETEEEIDALVATCFWICCATSGIVALSIAVWELVAGAGDTSLGGLVYLVPFSMLFAGLGLIVSYLVLRSHLFDVGAGAKIAQAASYSGAAILFGLISPAAIGLGFADLFGKAIYWFVCFRNLAIGKGLKLSSLDWSRAKAVIGRHRQLVCVSLPGALINVLGSSYTPMMLLLLFSASEAGHYALIERMIGGPVGMVSGAASQVFMADFSAMGRNNPGAQKTQFRSLVLNQLKLAVLPAVGFFFAAPAVIPWIFGSEWELAGRYAQIMTPLFVASFVVGPVNMALTIAGFQSIQFVWDAGRLIAIAAVWWFVFDTKMNSTSALSIYCAAAVVCFAVYLFVTDRALAKRAFMEESL
ncbi:MAG: oligosaccharide flippase family protein [Sulfuritalea sp.]|jgi:O-antigen/teichoic acid export membrane protein|nr:oligosaccharide flippase family protein [Sulfuritalea sp.]